MTVRLTIYHIGKGEGEIERAEVEIDKEEPTLKDIMPACGEWFLADGDFLEIVEK